MGDRTYSETHREWEILNMPGAKRFHLAQKLATVALGAATLAVVNPGVLPAHAAYVPPPTTKPAPGGYKAVVTSVTVGPAGAVIRAHIDGLEVSLTIPAGTFSTPVQVTLLAPNVLGVGNADPGYRAIGGVGVLITVNGKPYTGTFGHSLTLDISGPEITSQDRLAAWNGTKFVFVGSIDSGHTEQVSFKASAADFMVLAPTGGGTTRGRTTAFNAGSLRVTGNAVLDSVYFTPEGRSPLGIGVLAPRWLVVRSR
jgi:hypothetical protein